MKGEAIPAATIEIGADLIAGTDETSLDAQQNELTSFGDERARELGASGLSADFRKGFELGLATARAALATNPKAAMAGVEI